jgi:uncharacterized membrane protein YgaE (UPF0421/DUF939 family)
MPAPLQQALRAALAAVLAWLVVQPWNGVADQYPYYAPLGAVIAVSSSAIGSVRESLQVIAAIALGVLLAVATVPLPVLAGLAFVVGVGTWMTTVEPIARWLGASASYAPISGLFVLVIGRGSPLDYAGAYLGLVTFGAAVGAGVNLVWPPLRLRAESQELGRLREDLATQLDSIAAALAAERLPTPGEWSERTESVDRLLGRTREIVAASAESRRANWRTRRWARETGSLDRQVQALERLSLLVRDLTDLLSDQEHAERDLVALGPELRPASAEVLHELAGTLRSLETKHEDHDHVLHVDTAARGRTEHALEHLVATMQEVRERTGDDLLTAGAVVTAVGRTLAAVQPSR